MNYRLFGSIAGILFPAILCAQVKLFVVSDGGRNGAHEQKPAAAMLGQMADLQAPEAILALGDTHHYMGVQSTSDPLWLTNYELIYNHPELQIPWLPVLGNHEYRGNSQAVLDYSNVSRRWEMPARYYTRVFTDPKTGVSLRVVFIDTAPLIDKYRNTPEEYPDAGKQDMEAQLQWLEATLAAAKEDWIIVAGHHPIRGYTNKEQSERTDLQQRLEPIFDRHKVHLCIGGHIHNFQHLLHNGRHYVVNAAAAETRPAAHGPETQFTAGVVGFSTITATPDTLTLTMLSAQGTPLHQVIIPK